MKRVVRLGSIGAVGFIAWLVALLSLGDLPQEQYFVIRVLPIWLVCVLGCTCLWKLGWALLTFPNCEGDSIELQEEVKKTRASLAKMGISVS